ncbi:TetR/AcrR family transcriptional regulator [Sciscionella sediminilitoris]|uniref:TetR/AcrR family transcriptional regulator n=1 Tax=Sciscionella sediminilitoris TaxID=1445613 RepID=UPI00056896D2|nr:TetR/AcrR family transcriptional regulator [Sciscionella sp. SE31]
MTSTAETTTPGARGNGRGHRTQAERTEQTTNALLEATISCLVELGYARTSVNEICKRAGVSRGAQQHHFTTKAELMAKAIEHLATKLSERFTEQLAAAPEKADKVETGIELLWQAYAGELSAAALELWVAGRTDPELRAAMRPVDKALGRTSMRAFAAVSGIEVEADRAQTLFWMTVNLTRGLALDAEIGGDRARRHAQLELWKELVSGSLEKE